ncbi:energy-coupling factor transporter ATPase [Haploplasma modicum]|jgi:energy-coupling factor transport system ATP-binding protein|uniref:energy-coupling factor transporter ATPase n=1 Tax=Haploplasma modicum TaxID=2150 RepID=UPI00214B2AF8|nr:energy-coupling factor transporter ATPase [Haploplasma modicum]MCR1808645.1 energy-coupling factor transporter ATPase [Haploplasma modicum]
MIKVNNLTFNYNKNTEAIKNISLMVKKGKWISIIGHNGSGKSTFAKLLIGLLLPNEGEIIIDDIVLNEQTVHDIRKKIGIVFQNPDNQFVGSTVKYDIAFGLENQQLSSKEINKLVLEYARFVGMEDYLDKEPHNLSGGQKQRVAIAGALAMQHDIIILDEATSMLDPKGTNEIIDLIKKVNKEKEKTVITITHDLSLANLSDYIFVFKDGNLVLEGSPKEVFKEEEILKSSNLEIPFSLSVYNELAKDEKVDKKILEALWEYNLKM